MKIFITGGTGFIGRHLIELWQHTAHEITIVARTIDASLFPENVNCKSIDITDEAAIKAAIILAEPDVVIHSAAMSKPNDCEIQRELCNLINVKATQHIIDACKTINARLVFMSTDFVFGHNGPYCEADTYCPVNYYGESKVLAERLVLDSELHYAIVRTVMVYGKKLPQQNNTFLHWVKDNLEQQKTIKVFTDQFRSVTYVNDLCRGIDSIIDKGFRGIVHLCGETVFTPFELAREVADYLRVDKNLILPVTKETFPEAAVRPENSVLLIDKAKQQLDYVVTPLHTALLQIFG